MFYRIRLFASEYICIDVYKKLKYFLYNHLITFTSFVKNMYSFMHNQNNDLIFIKINLNYGDDDDMEDIDLLG